MNIPVKLAAALLFNEDSRRKIGWVIALILLPIILLAAFLCCFGTAAAEHNSSAVSASFYGAAFSDDIPAEYEEHITEMRKAFSLLDAAVSAVNAEAERGGLDPLQVKAVFYALCFGDAAPTRAAAANFVDCFYEWQERTRTTTITNENGGVTVQTEVYHVAVPLPLSAVYEKLSAWRGEAVTDHDKTNATHIYAMIAGSGGDSYGGEYAAGGSAPMDLDSSMLTNAASKNAADLVTYVTNAWRSGWGYVWGSALCSLTICVEIRSKTRQFS